MSGAVGFFYTWRSPAITRIRWARNCTRQKTSNQGGNVETLVQPSFSAPGGLSVQIPAGEFKSQITSLASQPGMSYLNDLAARPDVNWQPVKLASCASNRSASSCHW